jgi:hypothetical protein
VLFDLAVGNPIQFYGRFRAWKTWFRTTAMLAKYETAAFPGRYDGSRPHADHVELNFVV